MAASSGLILDAARLSVLAYENNLHSDILISSNDDFEALGGSGWTLVSRNDLGLVGSAHDDEFSSGNYLFDNGGGQAFVAQRGNVVALVFRGSAGATDWVTNATLPYTIDFQYLQFTALIGAFKDYLAGTQNGHGLVTGHSLGGVMAERFMYFNSNSIYEAVTFGSPGIVQFLPTVDARITNIEHSQDPVVNLAPYLEPSGSRYSIVLPGQIGLLPEEEHRSARYIETSRIIDESGLWGSVGNRQIVVGGNEAADSYDASAFSTGLFILGGGGNDVLHGGSVGDIIDGGANDDTLYGERGNDIIHGQGGNDEIYGGLDRDTLYGEAGIDVLRGEGGNDILYGGGNTDFLWGDEGEDYLRGGGSNDVLFGGSENDEIFGDEGSDQLWGESGNDTLNGGLGSDSIDGGAGNFDIVVLDKSRASYTLDRLSASVFTLTDSSTGDVDTVTGTELITFSNTGISSIVDYFTWWDSSNSVAPPPPPEPLPQTDGVSNNLLLAQPVNQSVQAGSSILLSDLFPLSNWVDNDGASDIVGFAVMDRSIGGGFLTVSGVRVQDGELRDDIPLTDLANWRFVAGPEGITDEIGFNIIQANGDFSPSLATGAIVTSIAPSTPNPDPDPYTDIPSTTGGSNLAVTAFGSALSGASIGADVEITYTIANTGDVRSAAGEVDIVLARSADLQIGRHVGSRDYNVPELNPGESRTYTRTVELPNISNGDYFFGVDVRSVSLGHNAIETDDVMSIPFQIATGLTGDADLRVYMDRQDGVLFVQGEPTNVNFEVRTNNNGSPTYDYRVLLSRDETPSTDDIVLLDETSARGLGYHGTHYYNATALTIPTSVDDGIYNLITIADPDGTIRETNETNNNDVEQIVVISRPADSNTLFNFVGSHMELGSDTMEIGTAYRVDMRGYMDSVDDPLYDINIVDYQLVTVRYYISTDNIFDGSDVPFSDNIDVIESPIGAVIGLNINMQLPRWLESGEYYIFGVIDPENEFVEDFENDNVTSGAGVTIINNMVRTVLATDDTYNLEQGNTATFNILDNDINSIAQNMGVLRFEGDFVDASVLFSGQTDSGLTYQISRDGTLTVDTATLLRTLGPDEIRTETFRYELRGFDDGTADLGEVTVRIGNSENPRFSIISGDFSNRISEDDVSVSGTIAISAPAGATETFAGISAEGTYGSLSVNINGDQWTYTPSLLTQFLDEGEFVEDTLILTASNGATQEISITIDGIDDPAAIIGNTSQRLLVSDGSINGSVTFYDIDTADTATLIGTTIVGTYGEFTISSSGIWSYGLIPEMAQTVTLGLPAVEIVSVMLGDGSISDFDFTITGDRTSGLLINGTFAAETLNGTSGNDDISGLDGNDRLLGNAGNDTLIGGDGNDELRGGAGNDTAVFSGVQAAYSVTENANGSFTVAHTGGSQADGTDTLTEVEFARFDDATVALGAPTAVVQIGTDGADILTGGDGDDTLNGGDGTDTLIGGAGDDTLIGGTSTADRRDVIYGGDGDDVIDGGYGNDELRGDAGNDRIAGGFGADTLIGGTGDDVMTGSAFSDLLFGGDGMDFVNGGFGHDRVNGGADADRFFHIGIRDHGSDWIQDYNATEGDTLLFGIGSATGDDFHVTFAHTENAADERSGDDAVEEAFVIYRPTGQIMWALVDGGGQAEINIVIGGATYDLLS